MFWLRNLLIELTIFQSSVIYVGTPQKEKNGDNPTPPISEANCIQSSIFNYTLLAKGSVSIFCDYLETYVRKGAVLIWVFTRRFEFIT